MGISLSTKNKHHTHKKNIDQPTTNQNEQKLRNVH